MLTLNGVLCAPDSETSLLILATMILHVVGVLSTHGITLVFDVVRLYAGATDIFV